MNRRPRKLGPKGQKGPGLTIICRMYSSMFWLYLFGSHVRFEDLRDRRNVRVWGGCLSPVRSWSLVAVRGGPHASLCPPRLRAYRCPARSAMGAILTGTMVYAFLGVLATGGSFFVPAMRSDRGYAARTDPPHPARAALHTALAQCRSHTAGASRPARGMRVAPFWGRGAERVDCAGARAGRGGCRGREAEERPAPRPRDGVR